MAAVGEKFRKKIKLVALTMVSYHEVAFTFDAEFLITAFAEVCCQGNRFSESAYLAFHTLTLSQALLMSASAFSLLTSCSLTRLEANKLLSAAVHRVKSCFNSR